MQSQPKDLRTFLKIFDDRWPGEVLRVDTQGKTFDLAQCDAAAFLAKLKAGGKRPLTLFRGFKTLNRKLCPGELLFSEPSTLRKQAAAMRPSWGRSRIKRRIMEGDAKVKAVIPNEREGSFGKDSSSLRSSE
jgi:hypothetical protein